MITKHELASYYFPHMQTASALNKLAKWINNCPPLLEKLQKSGYNTRAHSFTAKQEALIYEYLGEA